MRPVKPISFYLLGFVMFVVGIKMGSQFPDIDQKLPFLMHRSILTHGLLLPLMAFLALQERHHHGLRSLAIGFCLGMAVHLCFDLFPLRWRGYALIWVPLHGRTTEAFSWLWIATSCVVCVYLALRLIRYALEIVFSAVGTVFVFLLNTPGERAVIGSLTVLAVSTLIALALPSRASEMIRTMASKSS